MDLELLLLKADLEMDKVANVVDTDDEIMRDIANGMAYGLALAGMTVKDLDQLVKKAGLNKSADILSTITDTLTTLAKFSLGAAAIYGISAFLAGKYSGSAIGSALGLLHETPVMKYDIPAAEAIAKAMEYERAKRKLKRALKGTEEASALNVLKTIPKDKDSLDTDNLFNERTAIKGV